MESEESITNSIGNILKMSPNPTEEQLKNGEVTGETDNSIIDDDIEGTIKKIEKFLKNL